MNKEELLKEAMEQANAAAENAESNVEEEISEAEEATRSADDMEDAENKDAKKTKKVKIDQEEKVEKDASSKKASRKKADKSKERIQELEDKVTRQLAEFENFRKRTELEKMARFDMGAKSVLEKILPVVDNFERGLAGVSEGKEEDSFVNGMNMVYKQLLNELETIGVKVIPTVGEEFNPELHNAVMQVESDEYESGFVAQEMLKGYTYKGNVVRHSMVAVVS